MLDTITSNQMRKAHHFNSDSSSVTSLPRVFMVLSSVVVEFGWFQEYV